MRVPKFNQFFGIVCILHAMFGLAASNLAVAQQARNLPPTATPVASGPQFISAQVLLLSTPRTTNSRTSTINVRSIESNKILKLVICIGVRCPKNTRTILTPKSLKLKKGLRYKISYQKKDRKYYARTVKKFVPAEEPSPIPTLIQPVATETSSPPQIPTFIPSTLPSITPLASITARATTTPTARPSNSPPINLPPVVVFTSPNSGASFTTPATIAIAATATDSDGAISQVEFFNGLTLLGTDTTAPFSFNWTSVPAGNYTLRAVATDNKSATAEASPILINVATNIAPSITLTAPTNGSQFENGVNIVLSASASDPDGTISKVEYYRGPTLLGTDTSAPYTFTWTNATQGTYSISAKAYDNSGALSGSNGATIIVKPPPSGGEPIVAITSPAMGATFLTPANISISATASDSGGAVSKLEFFNGATLLGTDTTAPYSFSWNSVAAGTYTIIAKATDNSGLTNTASVVVSVNSPATPTPTSTSTSTRTATPSATRTNTPTLTRTATFTATRTATPIATQTATHTNTPTVSGTFSIEFKNLVNGTTFIPPGSVDFAVAVAGGAIITKYQLFIDGGLVQTLTYSPAVYNYSLAASSSFHTARVVVTDSASRTAQAIATFRVNSIKPAQFPSNPYYLPQEVASVARDWAISQDPLVVPDDGDPNTPIVTKGPIPIAQRKFINFVDGLLQPSIKNFSTLLTSNPDNLAGSYDDGYVNLESTAHAPLKGQSWWSVSKANSLSGQAILFPFAIQGQSVFAKYGSVIYPLFGVNFSANSVSGQGHTRAMFLNPQYEERQNYFLNYLPIAPAYLSYVDSLPQRTIDSYDGLFTHYLNSTCQSGSEGGWVSKFFIAGGALPYSTKRVLKATGNYTAILQYLLRASLPYADENGNPLPFDNEIRHRPAYLSIGDLRSQKYFAVNESYHRYNDELFLRQMISKARTMLEPPPVTILSLVDFSVKKGNSVLVDHATSDPSGIRIKSFAATSARIWGQKDETIELRVDFGASYDLGGRALQYSLKPLYPEQASVIQITPDGTPSRFIVKVNYDSLLPRFRIPIIAIAHTGDGQGVPAFINFFYPQDGSNYLNYDENTNPSFVVNNNQRPFFVSDRSHEIVASVGQQVHIHFSCTDPEGYNTRYYRWQNEPGTLSNGLYTFTIPTEYEGLSIPLHFICSDGTGAYDSLDFVIGVPHSNALPNGYKSTNLGTVFSKGAVTLANNGDFNINAAGGLPSQEPNHTGIANYSRNDSGIYLSKLISGDIDIQAKVASVIPTHPSTQAYVALSLRENLDPTSPGYRASIARHDVAGTATTVRASYRRRNNENVLGGTQCGPVIGLNAQYLRSLRRGSDFVSFASLDGIEWEQFHRDVDTTAPLEMRAGLLVSAQNSNSPDSDIKLASVTGNLFLNNPRNGLSYFIKSSSNSAANTPPDQYPRYQLTTSNPTFTLRVSTPADATGVFYSINKSGFPDTLMSGDTITLTQLGFYEIRVQPIFGAIPGAVTVLRFELISPL